MWREKNENGDESNESIYKFYTSWTNSITSILLNVKLKSQRCNIGFFLMDLEETKNS